MSKVQTRRAAANKRRAAAAEEEKEEQHKLLDGVIEPEVRVHRAEFQQLLVIKEEVEWSSSLDQEDPPELPHIKEEQEELWTSQEGEQLGGLEEADIIKFTFTPVTVKSEEDDDDEPQSSQLHQIKTEEIGNVELWQTESDEEDCGGPEPARNFDPDSNLQPATHNETSHSSEAETDEDASESETDDSCDWEETSEPQNVYRNSKESKLEKNHLVAQCVVKDTTQRTP
ncbi:uncharacterized protein [Pagrus major]|uniref:uncharacterized protein n=1 Tax=Pagrus major TaxID=143350 RepID=UPI003CC894EC